MPTMFAACFFIFSQAAEASGNFILSGGSSPTDNFCVDDDIYVYLNGNLIYSDIDPYVATCGNRPINFQADAGAELRVVAIDSSNICRGIGPLWLHYGDQSVELDIGQNDGCLSRPAGTVFYDKNFIIPQSAELEPVIIVPGIMGSYLNKEDEEEVWMNLDKMVLNISDDDYLNYLMMDENGGSINIIKTGDIVRSVEKLRIINIDILNGLIETLNANGYEENKNLFVFPYDWRQSIDLTASRLNQKILDVLSQTGAQKVNIIAHSLGGLVTKGYMKEYASQNKINKFVSIATPNLGAPKAFKVLKYGDNLGVKVILSENRIKVISQNMPSIYELLPSAAYYDSDHIDYDYIYSDQGHNYSYEEMNLHLEIFNNSILVNKAKEFHNNIDNYNGYAGDTKTYNIIGCGFATIGKITKLNQGRDHHEYRIDYISGDGTVPLKSAEGISAYKKYYYDGAEHISLPSANGVTQLIGSILDDEESQFDLSPYPISVQSNNCLIRGRLVTYHSPIALHAYDENGNHAGPNANGEIENQILGAQYDVIEDNKFVFLPSGHTYNIVGQATGLGTFNSRVETIDDGRVTQTAYYNQIPITSTSANVEMIVTDSQTDYTMKIDQDGDKIFETTTQPSSILDEQDSGDLIKPVTIISISGTQGSDGWYTTLAQISFAASDNDGGSGVLKTEYSLDDGQTWQAYIDAVSMNKQGANKILYKSTDRAGNIEEEKTTEFKIDSIPPAIEMIAPLSNDAYDHAEKLEILYNSVDNTSGLNDSAAILQIDGQNISTTSIDLFPYNLGGHQLIIKTVDLAGNQIATTVPFSITTSLPGAINDVKRLYSENQIIKASVKDELVGGLNSIQGYIERFGQRQNNRLFRYQERLAKCDKQKKRVAECKESVKRLYERQKYVLNTVHSKIVSIKLTNLMKDLGKYYNKKWLTPRAYEIIKEELVYLKNNL